MDGMGEAMNFCTFVMIYSAVSAVSAYKRDGFDYESFKFGVLALISLAWMVWEGK